MGLSLAGPRYIAIPIDGVDVIELSPLPTSSAGAGPRIARQTEAYLPMAVHQQHASEFEQSRPATAHILDYVDFGAHTGPNGAFSWYADYPSHH